MPLGMYSWKWEINGKERQKYREEIDSSFEFKKYDACPFQKACCTEWADGEQI